MQTTNMEFLQWSCHDVARWIEGVGFPQYAACFTENFISGRKLIYVNCSHLPELGITDFKDMQVISARVRELLGITETPWRRGVADPRRDPAALFLEAKSRTGERADNLSPQRFRHDACTCEEAETSDNATPLDAAAAPACDGPACGPH